MHITGRLCDFAIFATPTGVLPWIVWLSIRPSPVITRFVSTKLLARSTISITRSTPGFTTASIKPINAAPIPPAAPAPGFAAIFLPVLIAKTSP